MYLYIPSLGMWTSHPFSVAWTSTATGLLEKCNSNDSADFLLPPERKTMSFLIKGRDGFTNKLLQKAMGSVDDRFEVTALAEGPFGRFTPSIVAYDLRVRRASFPRVIRDSGPDRRRHWNHTPSLLPRSFHARVLHERCSHSQGDANLDHPQSGYVYHRLTTVSN